jgi:AraC-like DNA-binding protein
MLLVATYIFYIYTTKDDMLYFLKYNRQGVHFEEYNFFVLRVSRYIHLILIALQGLLYSIAFMKFPKEYNEKLQNEFSNIDSFSIEWINKYLLTFAVIVASGFIVYAIYPLKGLADFIIKFVFLVFSGYVCRLGILALQQQTLEIDLDVIIPDILIEKDISHIKDDILIRKLDFLMTKKQVFLQPDLSLTSLSKELGTNRTYLSILINQQHGVNFNVYINGLRTDFAKEFLINNPSVNKEDLYTIAGFGSLSTMNRALSTKKSITKVNLKM